MNPVESRYAQWQARLLDTSRRNRLVYFKPGRRGQVHILAPTADEIYNALVLEGRRLTFIPAELKNPPDATDDDALPYESNDVANQELPPDDSVVPSGTTNLLAEAAVTPSDTTNLHPAGLDTNLTPEQLSTALYNLRAQARIALEEQGANVLFLSFGLLRWIEPASGETILSPLLLVPVQLDRAAITQPFTLQTRDEEILLNPTLAHKLKLDCGIALPELPEDPDPIQPSALFDALREALPPQSGWEVLSEVYLELFAFETLGMLNDLAAHAADLQAHPLVRALAGDPSALPVPPADLPRASELDERIKPSDTFQVLDADSSQQVAIEWSKRGVSFVIQGPPGTGKSQTIANIIAEALAQNKTVLFVSAKMAALQVVYQRLAECGLAQFCLQAHSLRANRGAIVAELGQALSDAEKTAPERPAPTADDASPKLRRPNGEDERLTRLTALRDELNAHARALHTPIPPLMQTPFQVHSALAALATAPELAFELADVARLSAEELDEILEALEVLAANPQLWEERDRHPWGGIVLEASSLCNKTDLAFHLGELWQRLAPLEAAAGTLGEALGVEAARTLSDIERLDRVARLVLDTPAPPTDWFRRGRTAELRALADEARRTYKAHLDGLSELTRNYTAELIDLPELDTLVRRFETAYANPLRRLDGSYRADLALVRKTARQTADSGEHRISYAEALRALKQAKELRAQRDWINARQDEHSREFGRMYKGTETDWERVFAALDWVDALAAQYHPDAVPETLINLVCNRPSRVARARQPANELHAQLKILDVGLDYYLQLFPDRVESLPLLPLSEFKQELQEKLERIDDLELWLNFRASWKALEELGLRPFLQSAQEAHLQADELRPAFLRRFYQLWLDAAAGQQPLLRESGESRRRSIVRFQRDDVAQINLARERITRRQRAFQNHLLSRVPERSAAPSPAADMPRQIAVLKRELARRRRHKTLRQLFAEIPDLLLAIKPCLMLSPLSVSQYLSAANLRFDLVIFDEASQLPPEAAIAAIGRAKQMIVAGDHQQLPPTPFFQTLGLDEREAEGWSTSETLESLLQEASICLPAIPLRWHYRSRTEALLTFSNRHFYENRLITFPSALRRDAGQGDSMGVEFVYVPDGVYDRARTRRNPVEARRVVALIFEHWARFPERSLGVVTFSRAQRDAIDQQLQSALRERPEFEVLLGGPLGGGGNGREPFFIKSLENVQGDERDVMLFSIGYGKDANGRLTLNFGPLNALDGARRLNVAITRARYQVKIISSFLPGELDVARTDSRGVRLLRAYMDYASSGALEQSGESAHSAVYAEEEERQLVALVKQALEARGLQVHTAIGSSSERVDLAVIDRSDPRRYALGIELDGATYRAQKTARDRERLRHQVLQSLGWRLYRLWSRDWATNSALQSDHIVQTVSALETPVDAWTRSAAATPPTRGNGHAPEDSPAESPAESYSLPSGAVTYVPARLGRQGTAEQFYRAPDETLQELQRRLAVEEGPIHRAAAFRRIAACWGIHRLTPPVERRLGAVLDALVETQAVVLHDEFIWSPHNRVTVRVPAPGSEPRPFDEIALEEIAQAAVLLLGDQPSLTRDDLIARTARLFAAPYFDERVHRRVELALGQLEQGTVRGVNVSEG